MLPIYPRHGPTGPCSRLEQTAVLLELLLEGETRMQGAPDIVTQNGKDHSENGNAPVSYQMRGPLCADLGFFD
jgi:hypothetical protein